MRSKPVKQKLSYWQNYRKELKAFLMYSSKSLDPSWREKIRLELELIDFKIKHKVLPFVQFPTHCNPCSSKIKNYGENNKETE